MNTWAAVDLTMVKENLLDVGRNLGIFSAMLARWAVPPRVIPADRETSSAWQSKVTAYV